MEYTKTEVNGETVLEWTESTEKLVRKSVTESEVQSTLKEVRAQLANMNDERVKLEERLANFENLEKEFNK